FEGVISCGSCVGMFVEWEMTGEGVVHVSYLTDDYYHFDDRNHALIGERTAKMYRIGDEVKVKVVSVNLDEHVVDFELVHSHATTQNANTALKKKAKLKRKSKRK